MGRVPPKLTGSKAARQNKTCKGAAIFQLVACYITTGINPCMKGMILEYQNKIKGKASHQYKAAEMLSTVA